MDNPLKNKDLSNKTLGGTYKLIKRLGMGAFGEIYLAVDKNKNEFAIKLERVDCQFPQIMFEGKVYGFLHQDQQVDKGIPRVYGTATEGEYNYMIMELLGQSLEDLFHRYKNKLSLKTILMLGDQLVTRIELLHQRSFIHRDVKPDNFLMGIGKMQHKVYIVDMGLAKRYLTKDGHIPYKEGKPLTGTARYASINTHLGYEQSRRDDLEGLAYVLVYLAMGSLPWMNLKSNNQVDKYELIKQKKISTLPETLCKGLPLEFMQYYNYVRALKFEQQPDYDFLRGLFRSCLKKLNFQCDYQYEWTKLASKSQNEFEVIQKIKQDLLKEQQQAPQQPIQAQPIVKQQPQRHDNQSVREKAPAVRGKPVAPPARIQSAQRPVKKPLPRAAQLKSPRQQPAAPTQMVIAPRIVINKEPYTKM